MNSMAFSVSRVALLLVCAQVVFAFPSGEQYWWKFAKSDCGYDDVSPQPACGQAGKDNVQALEACCSSTPGCGGFNTHGFIKKQDCLSHIAAEPTCDVYVLQSTPQPPPPPPAVNWPPVWPLPTSYTNGSATAGVNSAFTFNGPASPTLAAAYTRYQALMFPHVAKTAGALSSCAVSLSAAPDESHPQLDTDESYHLKLTASSCDIQASTIYGAMRAIETLSQLIVFDFSTESYTVWGMPWSIQDQPRFPHRGLMIDTARHFQPLRSIRAMIDSLPYAKLNVLHWHISDSQSFPMESTTAPLLWEGAYSDVEKYTQADIAVVVEYARLRGVRVMVEFDMPGHAGSWCKGYPSVCPSASCTQPLNVANPQTFSLITGLLNEMTGGKSSTSGNPSGLFPNNFIHLGGDEVDTSCWSKTPGIAQWLASKNYTADDGYAYFVKEAASIAIAQGRRPVQWVEVFDHFGSKLDNRTIVHVWKDKSTLTAVVEAGYQALINNSPGSDSWYLDHLDIDWAAVYGNEPCEAIQTEAQCNLVLGGQGEMWGETVDQSDFEQTVWPKLAAISERLWSPRAAINDTQAALARLESFRCLLNRRGVRAAPVNNKEARSSPPGPGSCLEQ